MPDSFAGSRTELARAAIHDFLQLRLQDRLNKLSADDPKVAELAAQFLPDAWIADAARRVAQIQAVTHSLKPIHPDARGTNLYVEPSRLPGLDCIGSHVLGEQFTSDVVGNAAALDVYKFLRITIDGRSLLSWLEDDDPAVVSALSDEPATAREWRQAFIGLTQIREGAQASHARAKQVYWLVGHDASDDEQFHLLAPLYATSLAHAVHGVIQEDRFGDANKAARVARREKEMHEGVWREYRGLAVRKLGGTKPQNISQLNSERGGVNYLLSSLPPTWQSRELQQPWGMSSAIDTLLWRREGVKPIVRGLLRFLLSDPPQNMHTEARRDEAVALLIDELVAMAVEVHKAWPVGWSADPRCEMVRAEQLWLDPGRAETDEEFRREWLWMDWPAQIGHRFGNWLNGHLNKHLPVGDVEQRQWKKELLVDESEGGWARHLHELRSERKAPHDIPARQGVVE